MDNKTHKNLFYGVSGIKITHKTEVKQNLLKTGYSITSNISSESSRLGT